MGGGPFQKPRLGHKGENEAETPGGGGRGFLQDRPCSECYDETCRGGGENRLKCCGCEEAAPKQREVTNWGLQWETVWGEKKGGGKKGLISGRRIFWKHCHNQGVKSLTTVEKKPMSRRNNAQGNGMEKSGGRATGKKNTRGSRNGKSYREIHEH